MRASRPESWVAPESQRMIEGDRMWSKRVLVVGGAGYIGAHVNAALADRGYETVVLDFHDILATAWAWEQAQAFS